MSDRREFEVRYYQQRQGGPCQFSHACKESWVQEKVHCPNCGRQAVWRTDDGGDFYVGETYICVACRVRFHLAHGVHPATDEQDTQRLAALPQIHSSLTHAEGDPAETRMNTGS